MQKLKIFAVVSAVVVALSGIGSAAALAALPEFSAGKGGEKFTGKGGPSTLEIPGEGPITCKAASVTGEMVGTTKKEGLALTAITDCKFFGIPIKSLGDPEGTILVHSELKLCYISAAKKEVGTLRKVLPVHVELLGKLLQVEGDQVIRITPVNEKTTKFKLTYEQKEGKPKPEGCEGEKEHYTASINEGAPKESGWAGVEELTYEGAQTLVA